MRPAPPLRGFTLVEMLIVLAVLAVMASLAWPAVRGMAAKSELRSAAGNVRSALAGPRLRAIESGVPQRFRYQPGADGYEAVDCGTPDDASGEPARPQAACPRTSFRRNRSAACCPAASILPGRMQIALPDKSGPPAPAAMRRSGRPDGLGQPSSKPTARPATCGSAFWDRTVTTWTSNCGVDRLRQNRACRTTGGKAMNPLRRRAFSLLEVLLAMGIFLGSMVALGHLALLGRNRADAAMEMANAHRICQSRLNEILAGIRPLESSHEESLEDEPGWLCSVEIDTAARQGLSTVRVTVRQDLPEERRPKQFALVRWGLPPRCSRGSTTSRRRVSSRRGRPRARPLPRRPSSVAAARWRPRRRRRSRRGFPRRRSARS